MVGAYWASWGSTDFIPIPFRYIVGALWAHIECKEAGLVVHRVHPEMVPIHSGQIVGA